MRYTSGRFRVSTYHYQQFSSLKSPLELLVTLAKLEHQRSSLGLEC